MKSDLFDLIIVGGGINGAGIAAQAAASGLSVALCEKGDFASGTSSTSSKMIHGGLRYLEQGSLRLVSESLSEREILLKKAPHLVRPMRFLMPLSPESRPAWLLRLGLFFYDHLGRRHSLPRSHSVRFGTDQHQNPLNLSYTRGFEYSDCFVNDSRLVLSNLLAAHEAGASVYRSATIVSARSHQGLWDVGVSHHGQLLTLRGRALVNATGPWVNQFLKTHTTVPPLHQIRWVKGSHIVTRLLYPESKAYLLQNKDSRVVFVIPFMKHFTLIGTTEMPLAGSLESAHIEPDEIYYLCEAVNRYFHQPINPRDIVHSWSGVRPLIDDRRANKDVSREYHLPLQWTTDQAPLLSVYGGKLTTHRALAERAVTKLANALSLSITPPAPMQTLPGGDLEGLSLNDYVEKQRERYPWLPLAQLTRYAHLYGARMHDLLDGMGHLRDLGQHFGHTLFEREIRFLVENEWAEHVEDVIWRRTYLGIRMHPQEKRRLTQWFKTQFGSQTEPSLSKA